MVQKHFLNFEEDEEMTVGLALCAKNIPEWELFFHLNNCNTFCFDKADDLIFQGRYYDYSFSVFHTTDEESGISYKFISNRSTSSVLKKVRSELFIEEESEKLLLDLHPETDFIVTSSDSIPNFSLILLPDNLMFQIQTLSLYPHQAPYNILQYYE